MKKFLMASILFSFALLSGGCKEMAPKSIEGKEGLFAVIETVHGDIVLELFYEKTPLTVTNFVGLAEGTLDAAKGKKFYDGLKFHRVISDFMIQGGDPQGTGAGGPGYRFADEIVEDLKFTEPGLLAMANAGPGTNGSQFFITHVPTEWLNGNHTIFGKVVDKASQDVVNKVKQGDKMKSINIFRQGEKANLFTATQKDFDERSAVLDEKVKKAYAEKMKAKIEEVKNNSTIYDFKDKYENDDITRVVPARLSNQLRSKITKTTKKIGQIYNSKGVMRVDYLYDLESEILYVNEVNVIPGALSFYLFEAKNIYFQTLIDDLIKEAKRSKIENDSLIKQFNSNVLNKKNNKLK